MTKKTALLNWFLRNASIRHGHPTEGVVTEDPPPIPGPPGKDGKDGKDAEPIIIKPGETVEVPLSGGGGQFMNKVLPWLLGAAGVTVLPWLAYFLGKTDEQPLPPPTSERNGSIYQYLEDGNWHLPD